MKFHRHYNKREDDYYNLIYPKKVFPSSLTSDKFCCWCGEKLYHVWSNGVMECKRHFLKNLITIRSESV